MEIGRLGPIYNLLRTYGTGHYLGFVTINRRLRGGFGRRLLGTQVDNLRFLAHALLKASCDEGNLHLLTQRLVNTRTPNNVGIGATSLLAQIVGYLAHLVHRNLMLGTV